MTSPTRILIVDANKDQAHALEALISAHHASVQSTSSAYVAMSYAIAGRVDVVIINNAENDVALDRIINSVKKSEQGFATKFLLLGNTLPDSVAVDAALAIPFEPSQLVQTLTALIEQAKPLVAPRSQHMLTSVLVVDTNQKRAAETKAKLSFVENVSILTSPFDVQFFAQRGNYQCVIVASELDEGECYRVASSLRKVGSGYNPLILVIADAKHHKKYKLALSFGANDIIAPNTSAEDLSVQLNNSWLHHQKIKSISDDAMYRPLLDLTILDERSELFSSSEFKKLTDLMLERSKKDDTNIGVIAIQSAVFEATLHDLLPEQRDQVLQAFYSKLQQASYGGDIIGISTHGYCLICVQIASPTVLNARIDRLSAALTSHIFTFSAHKRVQVEFGFGSALNHDPGDTAEDLIMRATTTLTNALVTSSARFIIAA